MRKYQVWLNGMDRFVELQADDVNVEATGDVAYWNFIIDPQSGDGVTVAAFPFEKVEYVVSSNSAEDLHAIPQDVIGTESSGLRLQQ